MADITGPPFLKTRAAWALGVVVVGALALRVLWLNQPTGLLIFDETYYVNAARVIAGIQPDFGSTYFYAPLHLDPNTQHPPLGKVLIAGSIAVFGDNGIGWRVPSVIAGIVALLAVYGIVRALGGRPWLGVIAVTIYALDVLTFNLGRIAMLDMMSLALVLVGAWLGLRKCWLSAGALVALGTLVKLSGVFGLLALLAWQVVALWPQLKPWRIGRRDLRPTVALVGAFLFVGVGGLWLMDLGFTRFTNPFDHLAHMLTFGFSLQSGVSPDSETSVPWAWLSGGGQFDLLSLTSGSVINGHAVILTSAIDFRAVINPVLLASTALTVPYGIWAAWRQRDAVAGFALIWAAASFVPLVALAAIGHRVMYLYYALPTIPALAMLAAVLIGHARIPRPVAWAYLGAMVLGFVVYFPFRGVPG